MDSLHGLCRCCLSEETEVSLLKNEGDRVKQKFLEITSIEVQIDDELPQRLCSECYSNLNKAYDFREQCIKMDIELKEQIEKLMNRKQLELNEESIPQIKEIKFDPKDNTKDSDFDFGNDPIKQLEAIIKKEPTDNDEDSYYVLVIDSPKQVEANEDSTKMTNSVTEPIIKSEPQEQFNLTPHIMTQGQYQSESFVMPDIKVPNNVPATILENEEEPDLENDYDNDVDEDETINQNCNSQNQIFTQDDSSTNEIIKTITGKIINQPDGSSYIKLLDSDGTILLNNADQIAYLSENGELVNDDGDTNNQEIILCEGDDASQFQILKCGSELVIEYSEDGQITSVLQQDNGQYVCECGEKFEDFTEYEKHQLTHNPGEDHLCNLCGKGFETEEILTGHMLLHSSTASCLPCPFCDTPIRRSTLTQHIKYVHTETKPKCNICGKTFANPNNLKRHMMIHVGIKQFQCDICFKRFHQKITMQTHRITHKNPYTCGACEETFSTKEEVAAHKEANNCSKSKIIQMKQEVIKTVKQVVTTSQGKVLGYACSCCKKMFSVESALEQHIESLHMVDPGELNCSECGELFASKAQLQTHRLSHKNMKIKNFKRYPCSICGKGCTSQAMLIMHERVHTNERPFPCQLCALRFKTKTHLRTHQLTHTREKKFGCSICMKFFALKGNLVVHLRTHTGERPYECDMCSEAFIDSKYLKKHKQKRHVLGKTIESVFSESYKTPSIISF